MAVKRRKFYMGSLRGYHIEVDGVVVGSVMRDKARKWTPVINSEERDPHRTLRSATAYVVEETSGGKGETQKEIEERHNREANELYPGRCPKNQYPPHPPQISVTTHGIHSISKPLVLPPKDSWHSIESHMHEIEVRYIDEYGEEKTVTAGDKDYGRSMPSSGRTFADDCPIDPLARFSVRGRTCWRMEDSHPENRGFVMGRRYNGHWSAWSEWQHFKDGVEVGGGYEGPLYFWTLRMRSDRVMMDGESVADLSGRVSGEWREHDALMDRVKALFGMPDDREIPSMAFHIRTDRKPYMTLYIPTEPGEELVVDFLGDSFDPHYRNWFEKIMDTKYPDVKGFVPDEQDGATLTIKQA